MHNSDPAEIDPADLPPSLREMVEVAGLDAVLRLIERWGGVRIYLPDASRLSPGHPLAVCLGHANAIRLCRRVGAGRYTVPVGDAALRQARDRAIHAEYVGGKTARELALAYRLSERRIWEIVARA